MNPRKNSSRPSYKPPRKLRPGPLSRSYFTVQQIQSYASNFHATLPPLQAGPQLPTGAANTQE